MHLAKVKAHWRCVHVFVHSTIRTTLFCGETVVGVFPVLVLMCERNERVTDMKPYGSFFARFFTPCPCKADSSALAVRDSHWTGASLQVIAFGHQLAVGGSPKCRGSSRVPLHTGNNVACTKIVMFNI